MEGQCPFLHHSKTGHPIPYRAGPQADTVDWFPSVASYYSLGERLCYAVCLFSHTFILLSREEAPGVLICWLVGPHQLKGFPLSRFQLLLEILSTLICCFIGFLRAEISIVNCLIQGRYNVTRARVELEPLRPGHRENGALKHAATVPAKHGR